MNKQEVIEIITKRVFEPKIVFGVNQSYLVKLPGTNGAAILHIVLFEDEVEALLKECKKEEENE